MTPEVDAAARRGKAIARERASIRRRIAKALCLAADDPHPLDVDLFAHWHVTYKPRGFPPYPPATEEEIRQSAAAQERAIVFLERAGMEISPHAWRDDLPELRRAVRRSAEAAVTDRLVADFQRYGELDAEARDVGDIVRRASGRMPWEFDPDDCADC
jgi:hypothetical protein